MEEEWFFQQQGNKVTPKELKDCPDCGKPRISFGEWIILICDDPTPSKVSDENSIAEEKRWKMISQLSKKITHPELHPEAYYTSRPLCFRELPVT
ncbi:1157_t:CDS:2 [Rhizophagus irregularis]|nr:1157_t:CDS:2 [Rhizophagus irregularis]